MKKKETFHNRDEFRDFKRAILIMKLIIILLFMGLFEVSASVYSQNTEVSFDLKNKTIKEVLREIEKNSEVRFIYNEGFTDLSNVVTIRANNNTVEDILRNLLDASDVTYQVLDNNLIVIRPKTIKQQQSISGAVTDASTGEPLVGVTIQVKGTMTGSISQANGSYSVRLPEGHLP